MRARPWFLIALLFAGGCSDREVKSVTGRVTLDGQPLAGAQVHFCPPAGVDGPTYTAISDADGRFELFKDPRPGLGLKPGKYIILVTKFAGAAAAPKDEVAGAPLQEGTMPGTYNILPPLYNDRARSPFVIDLQPGDNYVPLVIEGKERKK
jgi:hypothetical protein